MIAAIHVTEAAARRVLQLIEEEGNLTLKLRVYVTGGGCSGMQYGFSFDPKKQPDDTVIACSPEGATQSIEVVVDPISLLYVQGATLDYEVTLRGAHFKVNNPNAQTTCGCGASFSVDED